MFCQLRFVLEIRNLIDVFFRTDLLPPGRIQDNNDFFLISSVQFVTNYYNLEKQWSSKSVKV